MSEWRISWNTVGAGVISLFVLLIPFVLHVFQKRMSQPAERKKTETTHEDESEAVLRRFSAIKNNTHCPFAAKANLIGTMQTKAEALHMHLARVGAADSHLDGLVLKLDGDEWLSGDECVCLKKMKQLLTELCAYNITRHPQDAQLSCYHIKNAPLTQLRIAGQAFGAMFFSPKFGSDDPRYTFPTLGDKERSAFVLFQPHISFARNSMGAPQAWRGDGVVARIRSLYGEHGRGYEPFETETSSLRKYGAYLPDWYCCQEDDMNMKC